MKSAAAALVALVIVLLAGWGGASTVVAKDQDEAQVLRVYREMYQAMLDRRIDRLDPLLDDKYSLRHITGYEQPKKEWLAAIESGQMQYHSAKEKSVKVDITGDTAVLVGRNVVTATIHGARGTWNLLLTTNYTRKKGKWIATRTVATTF